MWCHTFNQVALQFWESVDLQELKQQHCIYFRSSLSGGADWLNNTSVFFCLDDLFYAPLHRTVYYVFYVNKKVLIKMIIN